MDVGWSVGLSLVVGVVFFLYRLVGTVLGDRAPPEVAWIVVHADGRRRFLDLKLVAKGSCGGSLDVASRREFGTREEAAAHAREPARRSGLGYLGPFAFLDERPPLGESAG